MNVMDRIYVELDACNAALAKYTGIERESVPEWEFHPDYSELWTSEYNDMLTILNGNVSKVPF